MGRNYFIIHGSESKPTSNWFLWLAEELEQRGETVIVPQFPINEYQNYENWKNILKTYLDAGVINEDTVFIGHSLAPVFIIHFLLEFKAKVYGLISVSGFNKLLGMYLDEVNKTFLMDYEKVGDIINYTRFVYCIYAEDDPYIPKEELGKFAKATMAETTLIEGGKHLNGEAGYRRFDYLLKIIDQVNDSLTLMESDDMPIGINFIIQNEKEEILLGRRINRFGHGTYGLMGGKLKKGESFLECAVREIKEEIDLDVKIEDLEVVNIANTVTNIHFLQIGILVKKYIGTPKVMEPNKCDDLRFFCLDNLPSNLYIATKPNIELFKDNKIYGEEYNIKDV